MQALSVTWNLTDVMQLLHTVLVHFICLELTVQQIFSW